MAAKFDGKHARANMWVTHQNLARTKGSRALYQHRERKGLPASQLAKGLGLPKPVDVSVEGTSNVSDVKGSQVTDATAPSDDASMGTVDQARTSSAS